MSENNNNKSFLDKHTYIKHVFYTSLVLLVLGILTVVGLSVFYNLQTSNQQNALQPFYDTSKISAQGNPGDVVRYELLPQKYQHGSAYRIIYRTQKANGQNTFSSGLVFISNVKTSSAKPVVAWAHGTVGMGDQCAPSRLPNPGNNITWVDNMMSKGWDVTATDYAGLGTAGIQAYLVGNSEAYDVLNSVRAIRKLPFANASNTYAVWGHSQGGNSALFTANYAKSYAPELKLVGTVASAPAAELSALISEANGTSLDWVIGPEVMLSWPDNFSGLNPKDVLTNNGYNNYKKIAYTCIAWSSIGGIVREKLNQQFFSTNITNNASWNNLLKSQSAPILKPDQPLLVAESLTDNVVFPNTTALYIQNSCNAKADIKTLWLNDVGHIALANVISPDVINWISDRFNGIKNISTCYQQLPLAPF